jgi:hypothetical protein
MTEIDLRLSYKSDTGLSPVASSRSVYDYWEQDNRPYGGFPVSDYGSWVESKIMDILGQRSPISLREDFKNETGEQPTWKGLYTYPRNGGDGLKPEYTCWLEEIYLTLIETEELVFNEF